MKAWQSTNLYQMYSTPCGSWLASDDGLAVDQSLPYAPNPIVGASLLAKNAQTLRSSRQDTLSLTTIASRLAPTGKARPLAAQVGR
jgi:hypothetical protein